MAETIKPNQPLEVPTNQVTIKPNESNSLSWNSLTDKPTGNNLNQINEAGIVERIDAKTIRSGKITGTTLQTSEQGARVVVGGIGDEINDILLLDDSTGGTNPITGNTASLNFKRTDDVTQVFKIQKRAGVNNDSENVMEFFYEKDASGSQKNYIFLGNKGDGGSADIHTDIIQNEVNSAFTVANMNNYSNPMFSAFSTEYGGGNAGGTRITIQASQANTDNGASDGAYIALNILDNEAATGNTMFYVDKDSANISASGQKVGFYGVAAVTRPTALTGSDTNTPNTGDATTDNIIANLQTRVDELETKLQSLGLLS